MKALNLLTEDDWRHLYNRLRYFAYKKYGWLQKHSSLDIETIIQDAIVDTVLGVRRWPPVDEQGNEKDLDLFIFLCGTVRSKISHVLQADKKKLSIEEMLSVKKASEENRSDSVDVLLYEAFQQVSSAQDEDSNQQAIYNELCNKLRALVLDDELLTQMVDLWADMPDLKPSDIAGILGLPDQEIRTAQKRLGRRVQQLKEVWANA